MGRVFLKLVLGRYFKASVIIGTLLVSLGVFIIFRCNHYSSGKINEQESYEKALRDDIVKMVIENVNNIREIDSLRNDNDSLSIELLSAKMEIDILHGRMCYMSRCRPTDYSSNVRYAMNHSDIDTSLRKNWYGGDMDVGRNGRLNLSPSFRDSILVDLDVLRVKDSGRSIFRKIFKRKKELIKVKIENKNPYSDGGYREFVFVDDR